LATPTKVRGLRDVQDFPFFDLLFAQTVERDVQDLSYIEPIDPALALASLEYELRTPEKQKTRRFSPSRKTSRLGIYPCKQQSGREFHWLVHGCFVFFIVRSSNFSLPEPRAKQSGSLTINVFSERKETALLRSRSKTAN
jgi:hypothetical protein